jgi:hypothetical protein
MDLPNNVVMCRYGIRSDETTRNYACYVQVYPDVLYNQQFASLNLLL